jgi:hypothetical protein
LLRMNPGHHLQTGKQHALLLLLLVALLGVLL